MKGNEVKSCARLCKKCRSFRGSKWVPNSLVATMPPNVIETVKSVSNDISHFDEDTMLQDGTVDATKWCGIKRHARILWSYQKTDLILRTARISLMLSREETTIR